MSDRPAFLPAASVGAPGSEVASAPVRRRPRSRPWLIGIVAALVVVLAAGAVVVGLFLVTEARRSVAARDIDDILGAAPGVSVVDVSYSSSPFSSGRTFLVTVRVDTGTSTSDLSAALVACQQRWRDSPLGDDAVQTGIEIVAADDAEVDAEVDASDAQASLSFSGWHLAEEQTAAHVAYWAMLREVLGPVTVGVSSYVDETTSSLFVDVPRATVATPTDLADRIDEAASATPPAGRWTWSVSTVGSPGDDTSRYALDTLGSRPDARVLELWRGAAALASSSPRTPGLWLRTGTGVDPAATLLVTFPAGEGLDGPDGSDAASDAFVGGPSWDDAVGFAELVAASEHGTRLWIQVEGTFVAEISSGSCAAAPAQQVVTQALLEHLRTARPDDC